MGHLARWGSVLLAGLLWACGAVPEGEPDVAWETVSAPVTDASSGARGKGFGVSNPFDVSRAVLEPRPTGASGVGVAFDGRQYFVVWADQRAGNVFGARVRPDGKILDPGGIPLNLGTGRGGGEPRVAWDGKQFVVAWVDGGNTFGALVESDGDVRRHLFIGPGDSEGGRLDIACARKLCLVAYAFGEAESVILAARVDSEGDVLDLQRLSTPGTLAVEPTVAWDGRQFLVAWSDERGGVGTPDLHGARVRTDGTVLDAGGVPLLALPGAQRFPTVTWTGSRFLLAWQDDREGTADILGARIRRDLTVDGPAGFPISTGPGEQTEPRVAPSGSKSLVVWDDTRLGPHRARGVRVGDDGSILEPSSGFTVSSGDFPEERRPAVAAGDQQFFVAFAGVEAGGGLAPALILGTRVRHDGTVKDSPALVLTRSATPQDKPVAAFGRDSYLVAWREVREGTNVLLATRLRPDGRMLQPPIVLRTDPVMFEPWLSVAWDGARWLVVWEEEGNIRGARVSGSGVLLDASSILISESAFTKLRPAVASNSEGFLVVWSDGRGSTTPGHFFDIVGARVSSSGAVLDPAGLSLSPGPFDQQKPSVVAIGGSRYLVAWLQLDYTTPLPIVTSIRGTRVEADGTVVDMPDRLFSEGAVLTEAPALAWDGTNTLVAWASAPVGVGFPGLGVLAARVDADAVVLDSPPILVAPELPNREPGPVRATYDGGEFWLVWPLTRGSPFFPPEEILTDVYGARVRTDGTVRDPGGRAIAAHQPEPEFEPFLASSGDGRAAVFYTEFVTEEDVMNLRVQGRVLTGGR